MCVSFKAGVTKLLISQVSKFSFLKYIFTLITCKTGVMPKLSSEGEANSSDGLKHLTDEDETKDDIFTHLNTLITLAKHSVQVARLAEEFLIEDDIVQTYSCLTHRTMQAVFMPSQNLAVR